MHIPFLSYRISRLVRPLILLFMIAIIPSAMAADSVSISATKMLKQPDPWFSTDEGRQAVDNIISHQLKSGGWDKGYDSSKAFGPPETPKSDGQSAWAGIGTIDNDITHTELALLARVYVLTKRDNVKESFNHGIDFLLDAQYPNGGWPQRFPLHDNYGKNITFNDNAMTNVVMLFHEISEKQSPYEWVDADRRSKIAASYARGVDCILKCQVISNGKLSVWAQQHDPVTLKPAGGRAYELPGLSGAESSTILKYLMTLDNPSPEIQRAVHAGAKWYDDSKISGKKLTRKTGELNDDATAGPLWARFYELDTNRPFFCGRDGVKKYALTEVEPERIKGYSWYSTHGNTVRQHYEKWAKKYPVK